MGSMSRTPRTGLPAQYLSHEIAEVEAAIELVVTGGATSVSLAGRSHGEAVAAALRDTAASKGVVVEPIWGWEEDGCDVVVRRAGDAAGG